MWNCVHIEEGACHSSYECSIGLINYVPWEYVGSKAVFSNCVEVVLEEASLLYFL